MKQLHADHTLIDAMGGATKVAVLLGLDKASGGVQRVHNWRSRGIPPAVRLQRPDLFPLPAAAQPQSSPPSEGVSSPNGVTAGCDAVPEPAAPA